MILKEFYLSRRSEKLALFALLFLGFIGFSCAECACKLQERPNLNAKAETARWMVHSLDWGVVSTISSRLGGDGSPAIPFGNVYSFVDGPCDKSTGVPYLYGTYMDQSFTDTKSNDMISLTLTESCECLGETRRISDELAIAFGFHSKHISMNMSDNFSCAFS